MKSRQTKMATILAVGMFVFAANFATSNLIGNAYGITCSTSSHCYAIAQRTVANDGNKATITAVDLSSPNCNVGTFTATTQWVILNTARTDFIETGIGTGYLNDACQTSDIIYTFSILNGVATWGTHGSTTPGTAYTLSMDDSVTDRSWQMKNGATVLRTVSTSYSNGKGEAGAEQTHTSTTSIPSTDYKDISYYSGGWNLWAGSVNLPTPDSPLWRSFCAFQNYHHMKVGSGTQVFC